MLSPLRRYLELLYRFVESLGEQPARYFCRPGRDFTRRRLLSLSRLIFLQLGLLKRSNSVELEQFFAQVSPHALPATKSALTQARKKLLPLAFEDILKHSVEAFFQCFEPLRWKGFRLWATDGSGFRLPDAPGMGDTFGWHGNQHNCVPSTRMSLCFDLLNEVITDLRLHPRDISETFIATCQVGNTPSDVLMIYDRGYASQIIPYLHQISGSSCLIRMPVERSHTVDAFVLSGKREQIVTEPLGQRALKWLHELGIEPPQLPPVVTYRLIRFDLPGGEAEVLLTTLTDKNRYPYTHFGRIYRSRWGIESCFFTLKSLLQLTTFSAHLPNLCHADILANCIFYNLQTATFQPLKNQIKQRSKTRKHACQPNRNVAAGFLKACIPRWFLAEKEALDASLYRYHRLILRTLEPIRPDKNKERRRRILRGTERHVHEKNYRRAM